MNILREVLDNEVYPAVGCTEPVACAFAAAVAAEKLGEPVEHIDLKVDTGTFKNGAAVVVPSSGGAKGNLIAAAMGAMLAKSSSRLKLLGEICPDHLAGAKAMIDAGNYSYDSLPESADFRIEVTARGASRSASCVLAGGHTNIEQIVVDGVKIQSGNGEDTPDAFKPYRKALQEMSLAELIETSVRLTDEDREFLREGIAMNLTMAERGLSLKGAAGQIRRMRDIGVLAEDLFYRVKIKVAAAVDARMAGVPEPVMTSGGSGNQGVFAILVPYLVGRERGIDEARTLESIAVAHVLNAYVKCFLGELSVVCGCAVAAAVAAATAIVYQHEGACMEKITQAVNNVVGDLSGLICDGAKPGCSMKTVSGVDAAMRAAFMAIDGFGIAADDGLLGDSAEQSIRNLRRITLEGMFPVDPTLVMILQEKAARSGSA